MKIPAIARGGATAFALASCILCLPAHAVSYCHETYGWQCYERSAALEFQPASVDFSSQTVGTASAIQVVTLVNINAGPLALAFFGTTGDFTFSTDCPTAYGLWPGTGLLAAGASCTFQIRFQPAMLGWRHGDLELVDMTGSAGGHGYAGRYHVPLSGTGSAPPFATVQTSLASIDFGSQRVGTTSSVQPVRIANVGNIPMSLNGLSVSGDFAIASTCGATLAPITECVVNVTFTPTTSGARGGALRIESDATNPVVEVALAGVGSSIPENATGLWGNAQEAGWGIYVNEQGDVMFASIFTYASDGSALWFFASGLQRQADGSFTGDLFRATAGPPFYQQPWTPIAPAREGSMTLRFNDDGSATLTYTVGSIMVVKTLQAHVFGGNVPTCTQGPPSRAGANNFQDLWWNAEEPGWGVNIAHQGDVIFATLFTFTEDGRNGWYYASGLRRQADGSFSGPLHAATGPWFASPTWGAYAAGEVGTMRLRFTDGERGSLEYVIHGRSVAKQITRYVFGATAPVCR